MSEHSSASTETTPAEASAPVRVLLSQFVLDAGQFNFDDKITHAQVNYPNINLKLSQLDTEYLMSALSASVAPATKANKTEANPTPNAQSTSDTGSQVMPVQHNHYAIQLSDNHAGEISLQGQFQLFPLKVAGDVHIAKLKLPPCGDLSTINLSQHLPMARSLPRLSIKWILPRMASYKSPATMASLLLKN